MPFVRCKPGRIEPRRHVGLERHTAAEIAEHADANIAPGRRNDHGIDECPLDAVERRRLMAFVDDADRDEHHAGAHVEPAMHSRSM